MAGYILRRCLEVIPTILLVLTLVFLALRIMPGDPALAALGDFATPEAIALFREKLGLNQPLWQQYFAFIGNALTADFGRSMSNNASINELLAQALPHTIALGLAATVIGIIIGLPMGAMTAVHRTDQHQPPQQQWRGLHGAFCLERPLFAAGFEPQRMHDARVVPDIHPAATNGRAALDRFAGGKGPLLLGSLRSGHR